MQQVSAYKKDYSDNNKFTRRKKSSIFFLGETLGEHSLSFYTLSYSRTTSSSLFFSLQVNCLVDGHHHLHLVHLGRTRRRPSPTLSFGDGPRGHPSARTGPAQGHLATSGQRGLPARGRPGPSQGQGASLSRQNRAPHKGPPS